MIALIGTSLSYFLLGTVESILFLGLARIPSGKSHKKFILIFDKAHVLL